MKSDRRIARGHGLTRGLALATILAVMATVLPVAEAAQQPGTTGAESGLARPRTVSDCAAQITPYLQQESPPYTGLILWHNDGQGYSLCHPAGWRVATEAPSTVVLTPDGPRQEARLYIQVMDTPHAITRDDLRWRSYWFDVLVNDMPDADVSWQAHWHTGSLNGFEANYTYSDDDIVLMRWVRLLYVGTHQYWLVAEAPAMADSTILRQMFGAMMLTFRPDDQTW
jgi:hypothetical protein